MARQKRYGFVASSVAVMTLVIAAVVIVALLFLPIIFTSWSVMFKIIGFIFHPPTVGGMPLWVVFLVGALIIFMMKSQRRY